MKHAPFLLLVLAIGCAEEPAEMTGNYLGQLQCDDGDIDNVALGIDKFYSLPWTASFAWSNEGTFHSFDALADVDEYPGRMTVEVSIDRDGTDGFILSVGLLQAEDGDLFGAVEFIYDDGYISTCDATFTRQ